MRYQLANNRLGFSTRTEMSKRPNVVDMVRWILIAGLLVNLIGCVPAPMGKYYKPIYADAAPTYSGDLCYGKAGAPAILTIPLADGVRLSVSAQKNYLEKDRADRSLRLSLEVPFGAAIQFASSEIHVGHDLNDPGVVTKADAFVSALLMVPAAEPADMQRLAPTSFSVQEVRRFSASTWLDFTIGDHFVPDGFTMELPRLVRSLDTKSNQSPVVLSATARRHTDRYPGEYKNKTSLYYETPESLQLLKDKIAKCEREGRGDKCNSITTFDVGEYKLERDGFEFSGRWYVYEVEANSPFSSQLKIRTTNPEPWRFEQNRIRLVEKGTGAERIYTFEQYPLSIGYMVPMGTQIRGVNRSKNDEPTSATIESSLGVDEAATYVVRLPDLMINGRRFQIKPILLERRLLDFGLEPFNC